MSSLIVNRTSCSKNSRGPNTVPCETSDWICISRLANTVGKHIIQSYLSPLHYAVLGFAGASVDVFNFIS